MRVFIKRVGAARRRRPAGPSASPEFNKVELWATTKINIIFVGLAAPQQLSKKKISQIWRHQIHTGIVSVCIAFLWELDGGGGQVQTGGEGLAVIPALQNLLHGGLLLELDADGGHVTVGAGHAQALGADDGLSRVDDLAIHFHGDALRFANRSRFHESSFANRIHLLVDDD